MIWVDPVCAMSVEESDAPQLFVNGVEYRFCSYMCLRAFEERPGRYLKFGENLKHEITEYREAWDSNRQSQSEDS